MREVEDIDMVIQRIDRRQRYLRLEIRGSWGKDLRSRHQATAPIQPPLHALDVVDGGEQCLKGWTDVV
jgi:hypothetical protein